MIAGGLAAACLCYWGGGGAGCLMNGGRDCLFIFTYVYEHPNPVHMCINIFAYREINYHFFMYGVHAYMHECTQIYIYIYIYIYIIYICACVHARMHVHSYICTCVHSHLSTYTYTTIMHVCMHMCPLYLRIYFHTHTHIYTTMT